MDNVSSNNVKTALTHYRLLKCNAESKIKASPNSGGSLEITSEINTPNSPTILKKGDSFVVKVFIGIIGKSKGSKEIAFSASCSFEGDYLLVDCNKSGVATKNNLILWSLAVNQLHPLVSQFVTDIVSRMGFKNIIIPPLLPGQYAPKQSPEKTLPEKTNKSKQISAKAK